MMTIIAAVGGDIPRPKLEQDVCLTRRCLDDGFAVSDAHEDFGTRVEGFIPVFGVEDDEVRGVSWVDAVIVA